jgi:hypothetical protein
MYEHIPLMKVPCYSTLPFFRRALWLGHPTTVHFPPGTGGGKGVAHGRESKGILIHSLTDGAGMPLSMCTSPANRDERAQALPLLDAMHVRTGKQG